MNATDYIFKNESNKTFPFAVEFYVPHPQGGYVDFEGFSSISEAVKYVEEQDKIFYKQK